jgi:transposase
MPAKLKIKPNKLNKLLATGKTNKEIAKHFKCSPGAVSQAKRRLGVEVCRATAVKRKNYNAAVQAAPKILKNAEDAKYQLSVAIQRCNEELSWISESVNKSCDGEYRQWAETALKHVAEVRKLISALADVEYKLHHVATVEKALLIMFEEIGRESIECQKRIRDRLEKASILFCLDD